MKRLVSPTGFQLKGAGWYVTDFHDKGKSKAPKATTKTEKKLKIPKKSQKP
ncbi:FmdB family zinc ribbon protein [Coxiella-like endosymbiont of Rhipicephalus sanguineus]|uniref:FmdB family zinc ribbon protein n=1 Tax=Coxiella-like endosymbiont of Rhipicephalus sanguineus TaxID=1955402 RepID=UPI0020410477|nr:hypothetical protein [Coxiella-like endosymbiont of Rhipicephalus sanguineus]